jgi:hypothetical protein
MGDEIKQEVKKDILDILVSVEKAFKKYDPEAIMDLSNHIIHSASIYQERSTSMVAIVVYSIGKIIAKGKIRRYPQDAWNSFETAVRQGLINAIKLLKTNDIKGFNKQLLTLQKAVMALDKSFMEFVGYVVDKAKVKKGAKIHEHGVSIKRVAELFGVSEWELRSYAGKKKIIERDVEKSKVRARLKKIRGFFK